MKKEILKYMLQFIIQKNMKQNYDQLKQKKNGKLLKQYFLHYKKKLRIKRNQKIKIVSNNLLILFKMDVI